MTTPPEPTPDPATIDNAAAAMTLATYLGYRDAPAAIDWLHQVLGFEVTMQFPDEHGGIAHAELRIGDAVVVVFSDRDGYQRAPRRGATAGQGSYLTVPDQDAVRAAFDRAVVSGVETVWAPDSTEWGNFRCRVLDPEGFEWTVGTHQPGQLAE